MHCTGAWSDAQLHGSSYTTVTNRVIKAITTCTGSAYTESKYTRLIIITKYTLRVGMMGNACLICIRMRTCIRTPLLYLPSLDCTRLHLVWLSIIVMVMHEHELICIYVLTIMSLMCKITYKYVEKKWHAISWNIYIYIRYNMSIYKHHTYMYETY